MNIIRKCLKIMCYGRELDYKNNELITIFVSKFEKEDLSTNSLYFGLSIHHKDFLA